MAEPENLPKFFLTNVGMLYIKRSGISCRVNLILGLFTTNELIKSYSFFSEVKIIKKIHQFYTENFENFE